MFQPKNAFSGFSVNDLAEAKDFYTNKLGLKIDETKMGLTLLLPGGSQVFVYQKDGHEPATFTILNLVTDDIDEAVEQLSKAGVTFEHYPDMPQDDKGILHGLTMDMGPNIAWFKDPAGNIMSVMQQK